MSESKSSSRGAEARSVEPTPDETTGLSLLVATGALGAFVFLGSAGPGHRSHEPGQLHEAPAIEVVEEVGAPHATQVAEPSELAKEPGASEPPSVKLQDLEVEEDADQAEAAADAPAANEPSPPAVPKVILEEEPEPVRPEPAAPARQPVVPPPPAPPPPTPPPAANPRPTAPPAVPPAPPPALPQPPEALPKPPVATPPLAPPPVAPPAPAPPAPTP